MDLPRSLFRLTLLALILVACVTWGRGVGRRAETRLTNAQPSRAVLVKRFVAALSDGDRETLDALRVSEEEYRSFILPGFVKPGETPRTLPEDKSQYFWRHHDTLNAYYLQGMLKRFRGTSYSIEDVNVHRVEEYAWYTVHRDPVIYLQTDEGTSVELEVGSIAEHDGGFKFISYRAD